MLSLGKLLELSLAGREPAEKIQVTSRGVKLHWLSDGVLQVTPPASDDCGVDLLLSAGIHGNEIIPIELLDRLIRAVARGDLRPRARLLFLFGNLDAIRRGVRHLGNDLNRLFCGAHVEAGGGEAMRAMELERMTSSFFSLEGRTRRHYDLHSAMRPSLLSQFAISPWRNGRPLPEGALERLRAASMDGVLMQRAASTTFSAYTANEHGAEAFTLELAEESAARWPACLQAFERAMQAQILDQPLEAETGPESFQVFSVSREIIKRSERFRLCLPSDVENFAQLAPGTLLAEDGEGDPWVVEEKEARILFPMAQVAIGQRAGLVVVPGEPA